MNWTIRRKLVSLGVAGILVAVVLGITGVAGFRMLGSAIHEINVTGHALSNHDDADMMHDALRGDVLAAMLARTDDERAAAATDVAAHADNFRAQLAENEKLELNAEVRKALAGAKPRMEEYITAATEMVELASRDPNAARSEFPAFMEKFTALEAEMEDLSVAITDASGKAEAAADAEQRRYMLLMLGFVIAGSVLFAFAAIAIVRSVVEPLARFERAMHDIATGDGDLTQRLDASSRDELGSIARAFNEFVEKIHDVIAHVRESASAVAQASKELTAASDTISAGAQEQASSLEETAASLEEITSTVRQNADNAQTANQLANNAREVAEKGGSVVSSAVSAMGEINASSRRIADIITTIDEIAFQTNLLALNAAVEAARAGEQGRGFAVVAAEVRSLAQRSATAAREIKGLIEDSVHKVESGAALVNRSGATLDEIVTAVKRVTDVVSEIAAASREQSVGIEQVNRAVTQMDQLTQSNAAQTEELSATAGHLSEQAAEVQGQVLRFRVQGGPGANVRPKPTVAGPRPTVKRAPTSIASHPKFDRAASAAATPPLATAARTGTNATDGFEEF
ncbi:MAG: methyl-accepting chemotaxis protein [Burkholderiaceae bacterium]